MAFSLCDIEYYKKFNPVPDSKILSLNWAVTNRDGSLSFRGGLKPENNPLHFILEYGVITISICSASLEYGFSNSDLAKMFTETYLEYINNHELLSSDNRLKQEELYDEALKTVKRLCRKSLWEKYKSLNPIMQCVLPILLIFGVAIFVEFIVYLIEIIKLQLM